ncbi:hypothetical protein D3C87_1459890 [compost metagenome]
MKIKPLKEKITAQSAKKFRVNVTKCFELGYIHHITPVGINYLVSIRVPFIIKAL